MAWIKYLASILLCLSMLSATATVERKNSTLFFGFYDDPDGDAVVPAGANVVITEKIIFLSILSFPSLSSNEPIIISSSKLY